MVRTQQSLHRCLGSMTYVLLAFVVFGTIWDICNLLVSVLLCIVVSSVVTPMADDRELAMPFTERASPLDPSKERHNVRHTTFHIMYIIVISILAFWGLRQQVTLRTHVIST